MARPIRLPSRFPVGTHYVVEGATGENGEFVITSRYVVLPNGTQVILPVVDPRPVASAAAPRVLASMPCLLAPTPRRRSGGKRILHA